LNVRGTTERAEEAPDVTDWNTGIIEEFRTNHGKVGGPFEGRPMLLLHHTGAKSGIERVNPLTYQDLGDGSIAIFGSKGGADTHPDWFHNLVANPKAKAEIGDETVDLVARVAEGQEHVRIWERQKREMPGFATYEERTSRVIPVIVLERAS
jgi:deazaflavin-dependent oxidoreductase (nitroreductase family)